jgi:lipoprotein-anchoring transpeptidase ErfK/SrfK
VSRVRTPVPVDRKLRPLISLLTVAVFAIGCNSTPATTTTTAQPKQATETAPTASQEQRADHDESPTTTTPVLAAETLPTGSSLIGQADADVEVYGGPPFVAPSHVLEAMTILGSPRVFLVETGPIDGWVEVSLPVRPNGTTGWVRAGTLDLRVLDHAIFVDLSDRLLRVEIANEVVLETEVAVGSPQNPTPTGNYFVTDIVELTDPTGPWGPFALGLSAFSDTISEFNGGDGIIGIHGTNRPASIGQPVSLGCVRVPNEVAARLAELVELGTPVEIQA